MVLCVVHLNGSQQVFFYLTCYRDS